MRGQLMLSLPSESEVREKLIAWGESDSRIRGLILTSSRARADETVDLLSDYDLIVAVRDAAAFADDQAWISAYGEHRARWGDEHVWHGMTAYFRGVVYADAVKVDYSIWPVEMLDRITDEAVLPEDLDVGYRVLLDKDGRTSGWPAATYHAHIPAPPTEAHYRAIVEEFWWDTTYVAKALWRGEVIFAKFALDYDAKFVALRRVLEWRIELDHDWALRPGSHGRGLERHLSADIAAELSRTYVGTDIEENWDALFLTTALFRRVATEVGDALGYAYPLELDQAVTAQLEGVYQLPSPAATSRDHSCHEPG